MKFPSLVSSVLGSTLLAGCCTNGCFIVSGKAFEELANITPPYLQKWEKTSMTSKERRQDSKSCGSDLLENVPNPDDISFSKERIKAAQLSGENDTATYRRLFRDWQRCMISKGYRYTGVCLDNEISRSSPACGAS